MGKCKLHLKDYQGAIADFDKALAIDPQNFAFYTDRANAKGSAGDQQGMCLDLRKASSLGSKNNDWNQIVNRVLNRNCQ